MKKSYSLLNSILIIINTIVTIGILVFYTSFINNKI